MEYYHLDIARRIVKEILPEIRNKRSRYCISVAGESGSGKSVSGQALKMILEEREVKTFVLQQDDYFFLPPKTNEMNRRKSLENVGPQEVNLELIDEQVSQFVDGENILTKPLVIFHENRAITETLDLTGVEVLIVEGTYISLLKNVDKRIFIDRDWESRINSIKDRARDVVDEFLEQVLTIEHQIISKHKELATIIIGEGVSIEFI